jgi:hypothetical protein
MEWEKKLDLLGPIEQAERCLALWLKEEKRSLTEQQRQRAAALMARYFHHEDEVTDVLMLSFLRHYSGAGDIDMEDPASVRLEIKAVLDKSRVTAPEVQGRKRLKAVFVGGAIIVAVLCGAWDIGHRTITKDQQAELKSLVRQIVERDKTATAAGIWADMKEPLNVRSYQDIPWWRYWQGRGLLEGRLGKVTSSTPPEGGVWPRVCAFIDAASPRAGCRPSAAW